MTTCSQCRFGHLVPHDIKVRQCWGAPPQAMLTPAGGGKVGVNFVRPIVGAGDDTCALFQLRLMPAAQPDINEPLGKA